MPRTSFDVDSPVDCVTVEKAGEILNKSAHSVRQLLMRGKIGKKTVGSSIFVILRDLETYYSEKKKLPSWEENYHKTKTKSFVALPMAAQSLAVQVPYVVRLIQKNLLEGYVTMSGDVMISRQSINEYLRMPPNESAGL